MEERAVVPAMQNVLTLEEHCMREIEKDGLRDPNHALFSFELLRRATSQDNQEAREAWQRCFSGILRGWLHRHPRREEVCGFDSEEHHLAQAFECFWQTMAERQQFEGTALATALKYLQASLQGVLLDTLRTHTGPGRIAPPESLNAGVLHRKDDRNARQWWECIQQLFLEGRERRVAHLIFHCNLSPQDIFCFAPQEFRDVQEICYLRLHILEHILLYADLRL